MNFSGISRLSIIKKCEDHSHSFQSAVQIHEFHVLQSYICRSIMYGLIIDPHDDQLPFGLIAQLVGHSAQLVRHCTGIVAVRVRVPVLASIFHAFLATTEVALKAARIIHVCLRVLNNFEGN